MDALRKQRREGLLPDSEKQPVAEDTKSEKTDADQHNVEKIDHDLSENNEESSNQN